LFFFLRLSKVDRSRVTRENNEAPASRQAGQPQAHKTVTICSFSAHVLRFKELEKGVPSGERFLSSSPHWYRLEVAHLKKISAELLADKHKRNEILVREGEEEEEEEAKRQQWQWSSTTCTPKAQCKKCTCTPAMLPPNAWRNVCINLLSTIPVSTPSWLLYPPHMYAQPAYPHYDHSQHHQRHSQTFARATSNHTVLPQQQQQQQQVTMLNATQERGSGGVCGLQHVLKALSFISFPWT
jgi:hypothetical protein